MPPKEKTQKQIEAAKKAAARKKQKRLEEKKEREDAAKRQKEKFTTGTKKKDLEEILMLNPKRKAVQAAAAAKKKILAEAEAEATQEYTASELAEIKIIEEAREIQDMMEEETKEEKKDQSERLGAIFDSRVTSVLENKNLAPFVPPAPIPPPRVFPAAAPQQGEFGDRIRRRVQDQSGEGPQMSEEQRQIISHAGTIVSAFRYLVPRYLDSPFRENNKLNRGEQDLTWQGLGNTANRIITDAFYILFNYTLMMTRREDFNTTVFVPDLPMKDKDPFLKTVGGFINVLDPWKRFLKVLPYFRLAPNNWTERLQPWTPQIEAVVIEGKGVPDIKQIQKKIRLIRNLPQRMN